VFELFAFRIDGREEEKEADEVKGFGYRCHRVCREQRPSAVGLEGRASPYHPTSG
jgi:hypothetical protein